MDISVETRMSVAIYRVPGSFYLEDFIVRYFSFATSSFYLNFKWAVDVF